MAVTRETLRLQEQLRADVADITDAQVRDLVAAWVEAWDRVSGELDAALLELAAQNVNGRLTRRTLLRSIRLRKAIAAIADELTRLAGEAGVRISADLKNLVERTDTAHQQIAASQLPADADLAAAGRWQRVDRRQVSAMVRRSAEQVHSRVKPLSVDAERAMKSELVRGIAVGDNPRDVAAKIVARVEGAFNGGLARATTIARTEMLDAHREAAQASRIANSDTVTGWIWHSEMSVRTCSACWSMDGSVHSAGDRGPDGHPNCRCTALPVTKSWADLGFSGMVEPRSIKPDARTEFISLSDVDQKRILGPARFVEWKAGNYPMTEWATVVHNTGWRDSVQVSRISSSSTRQAVS